MATTNPSPTSTPVATTPTTVNTTPGLLPADPNEKIILTPDMMKISKSPAPSPYTQRPTDPAKLIKFYEKATTGLKTEYGGEETPKVTIQSFAKMIERHLVQHGLLEEFYFTDRRDHKTKNILHHY
ncbi:MAG: hypothetical protein ACREOZ_01965, partial [Gloeomargaritales cyanobacterium]